MHIPKLYPILLPCENEEVPGFDAIGDDIYVNSLLFKGYPTGECAWREHQINESAMEYESTLDLITPINKQAPCKIVYVNSAHGSGLAYGPEETGAGTYLNPFINLNSITNSCRTDIYSGHGCDFHMIAVIVSGIVDYGVIVETQRNMPILFDFTSALVRCSTVLHNISFMVANTDAYLINMNASWDIESVEEIEVHPLFITRADGVVVRLQSCDIAFNHVSAYEDRPANLAINVTSLDSCTLTGMLRDGYLGYKADTVRNSNFDLQFAAAFGRASTRLLRCEFDYMSGGSFTLESIEGSSLVPLAIDDAHTLGNCKGVTATVTDCQSSPMEGDNFHSCSVFLIGVGETDNAPYTMRGIAGVNVYKSSVTATGFTLANGWGDYTIHAISGTEIKTCEVTVSECVAGVGSTSDPAMRATGIAGSLVVNCIVTLEDNLLAGIIGIDTDHGTISGCTVDITNSGIITNYDANFLGARAGTVVGTILNVTGVAYDSDIVQGIYAYYDAEDCTVSFDAMRVIGGFYAAQRGAGLVVGTSAVNCTVSIAVEALDDAGFANHDTIVIGIQGGVQIECSATVTSADYFIVHAQASTATECHDCTFLASSNRGFACGLFVGNTATYVASNVSAGIVLAGTCCSGGEVVPISGVTASEYWRFSGSPLSIVPCCS